ncbi:MAG: pseudaminic acid synthase [Magnetospirillum gryphiswaldense]|nr:pseudaminic acid synthase [Magnetospirillum gryphiswaldense]
MTAVFSINGRTIGPGHPPYVIAELSANHNGSLERAKDSIRAAAAAGAHAVKLQTYTADTMTIDCDRDDFVIKGGLWDGYKLYDLYAEAHTPFEWHAELFALARSLGIDIFSSPFDESAVDLLRGLDAPAYKIASFELTDLPLVAYAAACGKPLLMSTGMASQAEIAEAVKTARDAGAGGILLFHCVSQYPAPMEAANLSKIVSLRQHFDVVVGLSDHTMGNTAAIAATALGAAAIEKHFTLSRADKGPDSSFSLEPDELRRLVADTCDAWAALGRAGFERPSSEDASKAFRRSLYFVADLPAGTVLNSSHIRRIRPGFGLAPKHLDELLGRKLGKTVKRGDPVTWDALAN